ncbi:MAG TPA: low-specificity L-threonine aldolase [Firmicutes bacterium]|nr:low-specificity L-threonine aldolase [Bacillota bacterium]
MRDYCINGRPAEGIIDLRSDTVTQPTQRMREAMASAPVGDDVYGEDPTVRRLEELAAAKVGKESALFVVSGTQGNACAYLAHTQPGEEVILGQNSHIYGYEVGGLARLGGLMARTIDDSDGIIRPEQVTAALRGPDLHFAPATLVCIENTHNMSGGRVMEPGDIKALADTVHQRGLKLHMDGARVFNAAVALGVPVTELTEPVDSVMFCLSKGLSAPVGSILAGSKEFINRARKFRKLLGGGMRQVGVIAAAGIVALEEMIDRLAEDHQRARRLADGLAQVPGVKVGQTNYRTNILLIDVEGTGLSAPEFSRRLKKVGIWINPKSATTLRAVLHRHIEDSDVDKVIEVFQEIVVGQ